MLGLAFVLQIGLLLVLPQLAGLLVMRLARRASWVAWPAAAIAVFGVVWHEWIWVPARENARCGMWSDGPNFILVAGLLLHLGLGASFGKRVRRLRERRSSRRAPA
jgi:membrane protein YdbS with pleckstrin-like domain